MRSARWVKGNSYIVPWLPLTKHASTKHYLQFKWLFAAVLCINAELKQYAMSTLLSKLCLAGKLSLNRKEHLLTTVTSIVYCLRVCHGREVSSQKMDVYSVFTTKWISYTFTSISIWYSADFDSQSLFKLEFIIVIVLVCSTCLFCWGSVIHDPAHHAPPAVRCAICLFNAQSWHNHF